MTSKAWHIHADAEDEIERAASRYERERPGLGADFIEAFATAYAALRRGPIVGTAQQVGRHVVRRGYLARFPFAVVVAELEDTMLIVAVAHLRRHPTYWRRRLRRVRSDPR